MKAIGLIPARYDSQRLPGKPLVDIGGKTMIQRVWEQTCECRTLSEVYVVTDDERIRSAAKAFGADVIMTSSNHRSGTERCGEALHLLGLSSNDVLVNVQGDEPFLDPANLDRLVARFEESAVRIGTLATRLTDDAFGEEAQSNPNCVKVIFDHQGMAIYFSRSPLPYRRSKLKGNLGHRHIGVYAFRAGTLRELIELEPSKLEIQESLEQLRWIENGYPIAVQLVESKGITVDTAEDLQAARAQARDQEQA